MTRHYHPEGQNRQSNSRCPTSSSSYCCFIPVRRYLHHLNDVRVLFGFCLTACTVSSWFGVARFCADSYNANGPSCLTSSFNVHNDNRRADIFGLVPGEWMSLTSQRPGMTDPGNDPNHSSSFEATNAGIDADTLLALSSSSTTKIPRLIYIFWDQGWPAMDEYSNGTQKLLPLPQLARSSWEFHHNAYSNSINRNSPFQIIALDGPLAEKLTNRSQFIPDSIFLDLSLQAKSDIYRTLLLQRYGGIWVDATLFCNLPLDGWLNLNATDLVTFRRDDDRGAKKGYHIKPWVTSWFLAAPPQSYIITKILDFIMSNITQSTSTRDTIFASEYFWWHRIVEQLAHHDVYVYNRIMNDYASADPMHCWTPGWEFQAPVLKRCPKNKQMYSIFATSLMHCCRISQSSMSNPLLPYDDMTINPIRQNYAYTAEWESLCAEWNCTMHSDNIRHFSKLKALYSMHGEQFPTWTSDFYTASSRYKNRSPNEPRFSSTDRFKRSSM